MENVLEKKNISVVLIVISEFGTVSRNFFVERPHQGDQIGPIFTQVAHFFGNYRRSPKILVTFFHCNSYVLSLTKMDWATYWAIFSLTHLVTLGSIQGDQMSL
jgi:hypothetical protein